MWSLKITRADLVRANACEDGPESGMALFDRLVPGGTLILPPEGDTWTEGHWQLVDLWLRGAVVVFAAAPDAKLRGGPGRFYSWLITHGFWRFANLAGANLARANLAGADLAGADLAGADLARADLARANLARANLARANLAGADLARANLARANLAGADLARANLAGAYLAGWERGPDGFARKVAP